MKFQMGVQSSARFVITWAISADGMERGDFLSFPYPCSSGSIAAFSSRQTCVRKLPDDFAVFLPEPWPHT